MFNITDLDMHRIEAFWLLSGTQTQTNGILGLKNLNLYISKFQFFSEDRRRTDNRHKQ